MVMIDGIPSDTHAQISGHWDALLGFLRTAHAGSLDQEQVNGYLRAAEYQAAALLASVQSMTAANLVR